MQVKREFYLNKFLFLDIENNLWNLFDLIKEMMIKFDLDRVNLFYYFKGMFFNNFLIFGLLKTLLYHSRYNVLHVTRKIEIVA